MSARRHNNSRGDGEQRGSRGWGWGGKVGAAVGYLGNNQRPHTTQRPSVITTRFTRATYPPTHHHHAVEHRLVGIREGTRHQQIKW